MTSPQTSAKVWGFGKYCVAFRVSSSRDWEDDGKTLSFLGWRKSTLAKQYHQDGWHVWFGPFCLTFAKQEVE